MSRRSPAPDEVDVGERVRWGILGTGKIARILAEAIAASRTAELVAVGSRDTARAAAVASEFGAQRSGTYEDVLADDAVELAYIAMQHPEHRAWALAAAEAGKHVLCEKPLAMRHDDAVEIVDAARRHDVFLLEAFAYRNHPPTERLLELVREGAVGDVRLIDAVFGYDAGPEPTNYLMDRDLGGGSILDVGCYTTSMSHLIAATAGDTDVLPAIDVSGSAVIGPTGVDHTSAATLTFEGGVLARVACSIQANLESTVRIVGSEGRIEVPSPWLPGVIGDMPRIVLERWDESTKEIALWKDGDEDLGVYRVEADAVSRAVREGVRSSPAMRWEDSLTHMLTLDRWRAAIGLTYPGDEGA
jgi:predicted dehydrogenase